ncbi:type II toxin-antitoxin system RelE/ParE family toxin [Methylocaldum sp.]|uniref:type II toxin-antitoxin system RelE/ParE family toxin n=1 Tax=Methylocaldum sp. TaxID=1969727 RepID=UPI0032201904
MRIEWKKQAREDAHDILIHIAQDKPGAAWEVYEAIQRQVGLLAEMPKRGRPGRVRGTRELVITRTPYIVAYRVTPTVITVLRVLHGAQQWPKRFS